MRLLAAAFLQTFFLSFVTGSIFFPLSSVNVTLPHTTLIPNPLPPLVELALLRDIPDYLTGEDNPNKERFELIDHQSNGLFFIQGNQLRVHLHFFTNNFSLPRSTEHYSLNISGYLDDEGPVYMSINVILSQIELTCALHKYELCFWGADAFEIAEGLEKPVLGLLASPLIGQLCSNFSVTYSVSKGNHSKWLNVERHGNGLGGWVAQLVDRLDRETTPKLCAKISCTVTGGGDPAVLYTNEITVNVRDVDDNLPKIQFHTFQLLGQQIRKNAKFASGHINDLDSNSVNSLNISVESFDWPIDIQCKGLSNTSTVLFCEVFSKIDANFTKNIHFDVVAYDANLIPGYGSKLVRKSFIIEPEFPHVEPLIDDTPIYAKDVIMVPENAQKWSRIAAPLNKISPFYKFSLNDERFGITECEGIIYVKNPKLLTKNQESTLKILAVLSNRPELHYNITIKITSAAFHSCIAKIERPIKNDGYIEWCAELGNAADCNNFCGNGVWEPSMFGGCHWKLVNTNDVLNYSTCTNDPINCPDSKCDALEELDPGICPQDCSDNVIGTGGMPINGKGISNGKGICSWNALLYVTACYIDDKIDYEKLKRKKKIVTIEKLTPVCDASCQATLGISVFLLTVPIIIIILFYMRKYRHMRKRCNSVPAKEELATINYEEYVRQPLREPDPPSRPDYFDSKWEFPRHRLTIEETIGEGEFGMVLKARADGIQNRDGSMTVAVKTLKNASKDSELADLVSELELLKDVDHPNVIKLLGACTTVGGPLYVIIEYAEYGSLRNYLRKHRQSSLDNDKEDNYYLEGVSPLTSKHVLTFAWHIAKGMAYLTEMKLVHRDLAARNVLLTKDLVCKISDFGLTRDIYEDDTYLKRSKGRVPIKWMALESLADHVYTSKSDVWSYGILLWELVTRASSPYPGVAPQNLFNLLQDGYRMERPPGCSGELYALMRACWARLPQHRPSFTALVAQLDSMLAAGREYLDLCIGAVENRHYMENAPQWTFQGYDHPRPLCGCPIGQCTHVIRYENEIHNLNIDEKISNVQKL